MEVNPGRTWRDSQLARSLESQRPILPNVGGCAAIRPILVDIVETLAGYGQYGQRLAKIRRS